MEVVLQVVRTRDDNTRTPVLPARVVFPGKRAGRYSRPDVFQLNVNEAPMRPVVAKKGE
jgi:hypothetical protein